MKIILLMLVSFFIGLDLTSAEWTTLVPPKLPPLPSRSKPGDLFDARLREYMDDQVDEWQRQQNRIPKTEANRKARQDLGSKILRNFQAQRRMTDLQRLLDKPQYDETAKQAALEELMAMIAVAKTGETPAAYGCTHSDETEIPEWSWSLW